MPSRAHRRHRALGKRNVQAPSPLDSASSSSTSTSTPLAVPSPDPEALGIGRTAPSPSTLPIPQVSAHQRTTLPLPHPSLPPRPSPPPTTTTATTAPHHRPGSASSQCKRPPSVVRLPRPTCPVAETKKKAPAEPSSSRIDQVLDQLRDLSRSRSKTDHGRHSAPSTGSCPPAPTHPAESDFVEAADDEEDEDEDEDEPSIVSSATVSTDPAVFFTPPSHFADSRPSSPVLAPHFVSPATRTREDQVLGGLGFGHVGSPDDYDALASAAGCPVKVKLPTTSATRERQASATQALAVGSVPVLAADHRPRNVAAVGTPKQPGERGLESGQKEQVRLPCGWQTAFDFVKASAAAAPSSVLSPTESLGVWTPPTFGMATQHKPIDPSTVSSVPFALAPAAPIRVSKPPPAMPTPAMVRPVSPGAPPRPVLPPPSKMVPTVGGGAYFAPVPKDTQPDPTMVSTVSPDPTRDHPSRTSSPMVFSALVGASQSPLLASPLFQSQTLVPEQQLQHQAVGYTPAQRYSAPRFAAAAASDAGSFTPVMPLSSHPSSAASTPATAMMSPGTGVGGVGRGTVTPSDWSPMTPMTPLNHLGGGGGRGQMVPSFPNGFPAWPYGLFGLGSPAIGASSLGLTGMTSQPPTKSVSVYEAGSPLGLGLPFFGSSQVTASQPAPAPAVPTSNPSPLPAQTQPEEARRAGKNRTIVSTGNVGPMIPQPGDWMCGVCQFINWNRRKVCMRCFPERNDNVADALARNVERAATLAGGSSPPDPSHTEPSPTTTETAPLFKQRSVPSPIRIVKPGSSVDAANPFDLSSPRAAPPVIGLQPPTAAFEPPSPYLVDQGREARDRLKPYDAQILVRQQQQEQAAAARKRSSTVADFSAASSSSELDRQTEAEVLAAQMNPAVLRLRTMTTPATSWQAIKSLWA